MEDKLLLSLARDWNAVPISGEQASRAAGAVRHINQRVAEAALSRIGIDLGVETFDTFRARHAVKDESSAT